MYAETNREVNYINYTSCTQNSYKKTKNHTSFCKLRTEVLSYNKVWRKKLHCWQGHWPLDKEEKNQDL